MTDSPQDNISGSETPQTPEEPTAEFAAPAAEGDTQPLIDGQPAPAAEPQYAATTTATAAPAKGRSAKVGIVAALAVGALVGGVSGAGVAAWAVSANSNGSTTTAAPKAQNITVNDTSNVNVVTAVAAKAEPSVVTISVTDSSEAGTGSGVILSSDGYVLTNTHVVTLDGASATGKIQVTTADGHIYDATVVGTDPIVDLAVIKLKNASGLQPATFANSSKLNVGQTAVAIGAPLGLSNTVTTGIVSALNRSITIASSAVPDSSSGDQSNGNGSGNGQNGPFDFWNFDNGQGSQSQSQSQDATATISLPVIQTDAAINPGNSGGALLDENAKVIGINVAIASAGSSSDSSGQSGSIGVGFAIPANLAQRVANEIIKSGSATHGLLGASVEDSTSGSSSTVGALLKTVVSGGAADKAGLKAGDVVTSFNGVPITGATDLTAQVRFLAAGASTTLSYVRDGKTTTVNVTLGTLK
ncbi:MAG: hypothetical protein JWN36_3258 [Microbacteriaceae bacterium]|nr:hypothetical protein [Microbacteriaceae bacterium]